MKKLFLVFLSLGVAIAQAQLINVQKTSSTFLVTNVNSITSAATQDFLLGTGTAGTALTITSATGAATFSAQATASFFSSITGNSWLNQRPNTTGFAQIIYLTAAGQQWATGQRAGDSSFHLYDNTAGVDVQTWNLSTGDTTLRGNFNGNSKLIMGTSGMNHGIGGNPSINAQLYLTGTFDPTPYSGTEAIGLHIVTTLVPPSTAQAHGMVIQPIYTKNTTGTHDLFTNLKIDQMRFTAGSGTVAEATGIWISGPTQGVLNYSIHSANGIIKTDDTTTATAVATGAFNSPNFGFSGNLGGANFFGGPITAPSLASAALSNLTLGTGTFGTALTFTSATGAAAFAAGATATHFNATGSLVAFSAKGTMDYTGTGLRHLSFGPDNATRGEYTVYIATANNSSPLTPISVTNAGAITLGGAVTLNSSLGFSTAGNTISIKSGSNAAAGTFTMVAGSATVTSTAIDANTAIKCSLKTVGGTSGIYTPLTTVAAGSFTATSIATDSSTYNWIAMKVN